MLPGITASAGLLRPSSDSTAPTITSSNTASVAENTTSVLTVTATDAGGLAGTPYSITGGADQAKFTINGTSGALAFATAPDYETPTDANTDNVYVVQVSVTDFAGNVANQTINVTVTDVSIETTYITWDSGTVTAVTLSGGDLVATNTATTSADQGAHGPSASGKTTGKIYFELTLTTKAGGGSSVGIGTTASTYTNMGGGGTVGAVLFVDTGLVFANGSPAGTGFGARSSGNVFGIAVDLGARNIWFRVGAAGAWNNNGLNPANDDPVTGACSISSVPSGTMIPFCTFGGSGGVAGNVITANFGASSFVGAVPSGYTSGWLV